VGDVGPESVCGCGVVRSVCEDEEWGCSGVVHGVYWDMEEVEGKPSGPLDVLYATLDCLWCKPRGEVERFDEIVRLGLGC
jgi:hypothetical protein